MCWFAKLSGGPDDTDVLIGSLTSPDMGLVRKGDAIFLTSSSFGANADLTVMQGIAAEKLSCLNGILTLSNLPPFKLEQMGTFDVDGNPHYRYQSSLEIRFSVGTSSNPSDLAERHRKLNERLSELGGLARQDGLVQQVLAIIGNGRQDWANLYKAYEIVNADKDIVKNRFASKKEVSCFTHHANDPRATGKDARHAVPNSPDPPLQQMSISEANALMQRIVGLWVDSKLTGSAAGSQP